MLKSTDRAALIVTLGEQDSSQSFYALARLADAIMDRFGSTGTDDFLASITAYDPRDKKITAIKDLRDARRLGTVEGSDGLRECKDAVESWIARNPAPSIDPWATVSRESQYGYRQYDYGNDEPPF